MLQIFILHILFQKCVLIQAKIVSEMSYLWLCFSGVCKRQSHRMLPLKLQKGWFCSGNSFLFNKNSHLILWEFKYYICTSKHYTKKLVYLMCCGSAVCVWNPKLTNRAFILRGNFTSSTLVTCPLVFLPLHKWQIAKTSWTEWSLLHSDGACSLKWLLEAFL